MNAKVSLTALYQAKIHKFDEYDLEDFKDPAFLSPIQDDQAVQSQNQENLWTRYQTWDTAQSFEYLIDGHLLSKIGGQ